MELPKNLIQMGKPDRIHKIFVEDYIISYIKEWNRESDGQPAGIALYGQVYKESNYKYYFMYGASRIEGLDRRGPYLSQSDREEINNVGNRYFEEYSFLGWCIVREELPETIFLDTRGKAIVVNGYACFFEKNESMLNFMLEMDEKHRVYGERYPLDEDFLAALSFMPPASGCALGFDRLVMLATGAPRISEVIWTPVAE